MEIHTAYYSSPIGLMEVRGNEEGISSLYFIDDKKNYPTQIHHTLKEALYQLDEYFVGIRKEFGLKLNPQGSEFQKRVWNKLNDIPFGKTKSYLELSKMLGDANATRAVGNANAKNPICVIVPCHRVIGSSGQLVGYSGELWRKEWLLNHERSAIFGKQTELF